LRRLSTRIHRKQVTNETGRSYKLPDFSLPLVNPRRSKKGTNL